MTIVLGVAWRNGSRGKPYSANADGNRVGSLFLLVLPYSVFATRSAWRVLAGTGVGGYRTIGDDLKGDDDEGWRVPVLRGPHARAAPRGRACGLDAGVRAGCSGARVRGPAHMSARVSVFAAARAPRGRPVSLVCSCSRRPGAGHRRHRGRTRSPRTSGVEVRHPCRSADAGFAVGVGVGDFVLVQG